MSIIVLTPAYGRNPKSKKQAMADWENGLDWIIASPIQGAGRYCSVRDKEMMKRGGIDGVELRYANLERLALVHFG